MPASIEVSPEKLFAKQTIRFSDIPVNHYTKTVADVRDQFSPEALMRIYRDMRIIREFETSLDQIKKEGSYQGVAYNHKGPAHLSIGQEATAVGQAYHLEVEDHIYGSHRSHGEILAKGLVAIERLDGQKLTAIMETFLGGALLRVVEKGFKGQVKELARRFLVYGAYAEIFARVTGFNLGMSGSMHAFFTPFGIYPNNAIVGGSAPIATGAALYKRVNRKPGIVVCNIGDASFSCGPVWESLAFATMDQYRKLWDPSLGGGLPLIFCAINNQYGMGGQTDGETMGYGILARIGAGLNPEQMHTERVNGYNPLAVIDAIARKKSVLAKGQGPALLDIATYRVSGHSPSDASSYRSKEEIQKWMDADPITNYGRQLVEAGIADVDSLKALDASIVAEVVEVLKLSIDLEKSPRLAADSEFIGGVMFSNRKLEKLDDRQPETLMPQGANSRVQQISRKERGPSPDGKPVPKLKAYNVRDGLFEAIFDRFYKDPTTIAFGEENRDWGGAFAVYRGLTEALPYHRLFNSPISEAAIVGVAVGYGLEGGRAIAELMYCDFLGRAGDEVFNQLAKWQAMSGGILNLPVVLRISVGAKYGAQHSQDWSAFISHVPGLKAVYPVTPYDAKGMMNAALSGSDPVVFFESQSIYDMGEEFQTVPTEYYEIPLGEPALRRSGKDITIFSLGCALYKALKAADELASKYGLKAEVIDLRCINPLNYQPLVESLKKTGRGLLVSDACERGSFLHTVASHLQTLAFDHLDAPLTVIGSRNWITPAAELEDLFFPQVSWMLDAIHERILPLKGHVPSSNQNNMELLRRNRTGV